MTSYSSDEKKKVLLDKVTCPVCHNFMEAPKVLPTCKHVFCAPCIQAMPMTKESDSVNAIVKVNCSRCHVENEVPNGHAEMLKNNPAIAELFAKIKEPYCINTSYSYTSLNDCQHRFLTPTSELSKCLHCKGDFCGHCFKIHNEALRKEIAWTVTGFEPRLAKLAEQNYDKEARKAQVEEACRVHEQEFLASVDQCEQLLKTALDNYRQRSVAVLRKIAAEEVPDFTLVTMLASGIKDEKSLENVANKDLAEKYAAIFQADQRIAKIEDGSAVPISLPKVDNSMLEKLLKDVSMLTTELATKVPTTEDEEHLKLAEALRLRQAAERDDLDAVKGILERENLSPACRLYAVNYYVGNAKYKEFAKTPLMHAISMGQMDVVRYLVAEHHAHLDNIAYYSAALSCAAAGGYFEIVKYLMKMAKHDPSCLNFNVEPHDCETVVDARLCVPLCQKRRYYLNEAIVAAICGKHYEIAKFLLNHCEQNCEVFKPDELDDEDGVTLLHQAVMAENFEAVVFLVKNAGANIDAFSRYGFTALHYAIHGSQEMVHLLVDLGADTLLKNIPFDGHHETTKRKPKNAKQMADESDRKEMSAYLAKCPRKKVPTTSHGVKSAAANA